MSMSDPLKILQSKITTKLSTSKMASRIILSFGYFGKQLWICQDFQDFHKVQPKIRPI